MLRKSNATSKTSTAALRWFASTSSSSSGAETKPLFNKILIANRGEIAIRVMRTAKRLGVKTVAVFSEADRDAQHVKMADEAYLIGPAASAESYLRMDKIIQVAQRSGAQAIHPGYGFLSENAAFADAVTKAGMAVKGGGGKGMRIVQNEAEFYEMLESSKREATKSFGDDTVLVEKYIIRPRHVEVQVFADTLGNAVYLFERDCSVQRRHQKVLEEAPAPHLSPELRADLGAKAVAAAKAVNYVGAGTVEFILDTSTNQFYFMEMNTRLQVEHPITEMITNTDLVEWQLQVASGNRVPKVQDELSIDGWAFEARIYAENPDNNFLPDTGPLRHLSFPQASNVVRVETGVQQGDTVSVHYDPMISKLVVKGSDRTEALRVLRKALGEFEVVGLNTNIEFLKRLSSHPEFISGDVETGFIPKFYNDLFPAPTATSPFTLAHASLVLFSSLLPSTTTSAADPWNASSLGGFRLNSASGSTRTFRFLENNKEVRVDVTAGKQATGTYDVYVTDVNGLRTEFRGARVLQFDAGDGGMIVADVGDRRVKGRVVKDGEKVHVFSEGTKITLQLAADPAAVVSGSNVAAGSVKTPMPCKISSLSVTAGDTVTKGQNLIILEAMKMEHVIKSPKDGVIKRVHYKVGDIVAEGKVLVSFEEE
ncbi:hypothetical protein CcCBS67573_g08120 [Chytriomyces confervae]|uniref:Acetyl-CoA carboxylase n=1 Tax=Chytriomyces confervae TaxID=246404 RepID=A0A507EQ97_9FUNG|nr:hypothetical protein CcCBS67573_g08120 [Chytriomyces confervae]